MVLILLKKYIVSKNVSQNEYESCTISIQYCFTCLPHRVQLSCQGTNRNYRNPLTLIPWTCCHGFSGWTPNTDPMFQFRCSTHLVVPLGGYPQLYMTTNQNHIKTHIFYSFYLDTPPYATINHTSRNREAKKDIYNGLYQNKEKISNIS